MLLLVGLVVALAGCFAPLGVTAQREQLPPWREPPAVPLATSEIVVDDVPEMVELAIAPEDQSLGLGYRNGLVSEWGMLFLFEEPAELSFWMRGMRLCLDIVWIANDEIVQAAENACPDPAGTADADRERFHSGEPVTHVLEMPAGWLADSRFGPGTVVEMPESLR